MSPHAPRLLLLSSMAFPTPAGPSTRVAQRVAALTGAGYLVDVLCPRAEGLSHLTRMPGARVLRVPTPDGSAGAFPSAEGYAAIERAALRQLATQDYDAIHAMDPYTGWAVLDRTRGGGTEVVFELGGATPEGSGDAKLAGELRRRERALLREAARTLAPTEALALRARGLGARKGTVHVLRPSVDTRLFSPPDARTRHAVPPVPLVLAASRLNEREAALLASALSFVPSVLEVRLVVHAALDDGARRRLLDDEEVRERIELAGPVEHDALAASFGRAEVGVLLSTGHVRGQLPPVRLQALVEMMSSGLAVVAPDAPATREVAGSDVVLVPPNDPELLAGALQTLVVQPHRRSLLGNAARKRACTDHDERAIRARLLAVYAGLLTPSVQITPSAFLGPSAPPEPRAGTASTTPDSELTPLAFDEVPSLIPAPRRGTEEAPPPPPREGSR